MVIHDSVTVAGVLMGAGYMAVTAPGLSGLRINTPRLCAWLCIGDNPAARERPRSHHEPALPTAPAFGCLWKTTPLAIRGLAGGYPTGPGRG